MSTHAFKRERLPAGMDHLEMSGGRLVKTREAIEYGCLARSIRPDDRSDFIRSDLKRKIVDGGQTAKAHRQPFYAQ